MLTIVFYHDNGAAAKSRSRELAAVKGDYTRVIAASVWDSTNISCDQVEIMPDVPGWQRDRILKVYGDKVIELAMDGAVIAEQEQSEKKSIGLMPPKEEEQQNVVSNEKKAVHKGGGRWFVMAGEERISGPHDKAEAIRLSSQDEIAA